VGGSCFVLGAAAGETNRADRAAAVSTTPQTVCQWRGRFIQQRLDGLLDEPRPGAPPRINEADVDALIKKRLPERRTHDHVRHEDAVCSARPRHRQGDRRAALAPP
jgi:hypothetical protein